MTDIVAISAQAPYTLLDEEPLLPQEDAVAVAKVVVEPPPPSPQAPITVTPAVAQFFEDKGHTERVLLTLVYPLKSDASTKVTVVATQDKRETWDAKTENFLTRAYVNLGGTLYQGKPFDGSELKVTGILGGGTETLENPDSDKPLGPLSRTSTIEVFNASVTGTYAITPKVGLNLTAAALTIRTNGGADTLRINGQPGVTGKFGPVALSVGALIQTDQALDKPDSSFVAITAGVEVKTPYFDVGVKAWQNVVGEALLKSVNALPHAGGQEYDTKVGITVGRTFSIQRD